VLVGMELRDGKDGQQVNQGDPLLDMELSLVGEVVVDQVVDLEGLGDASLFLVSSAKLFRSNNVALSLVSNVKQ